MSTLSDHFVIHEEAQRMVTLAETWGYPKPGIKYNCKMIIYYAEDGSYGCLRSDIPDDCSNPFFWEDFSRWIELPEEGRLYYWEGYYLKYKNGNYRFTGKLTKMEV